MVLVLFTTTSSKAYQACTGTRRVGCDSICDASKGNKPGKGQKACVYACTACGESTSGIECPNGPDAVASWSGMEECDISGGGGGSGGDGSNTPTGSITASPNPCNVAAGAGTCTSSISWTSSNTSSTFVCVSGTGNPAPGTVFASSGSGAQSQAATWIQPNNNYTFTLYNSSSCNIPAGQAACTCSGTGLTSVTVTANPPPAPPPNPLPAASHLQPVCSADGTVVTVTWDPIPESVAYVVRTNAFPNDQDDGWHPENLGIYTGTTLIAPTGNNKDFGANTQGNTSTTLRAKIVTGMKYNTSIQGVRQGEQSPYKGVYAGADFTCTVASCSVSGDIDGNGRIEQADFDKWRTAFINGNSITNAPPALNNCADVAVDLVLFNTWRSQFARQ